MDARRVKTLGGFSFADSLVPQGDAQLISGQYQNSNPSYDRIAHAKRLRIGQIMHCDVTGPNFPQVGRDKSSEFRYVCARGGHAPSQGRRNPWLAVGVGRDGTTLLDPYGRGACGVYNRLTELKASGPSNHGFELPDHQGVNEHRRAGAYRKRWLRNHTMGTDLRTPSARLAFQLTLDLALHNIMTTHLYDETPGSRLRQFGMVVVLTDLAVQEAPLTISTITEVTGMTRGAVELILQSLVARGLVATKWTKNASGRGRAKLFHLVNQLDHGRS